MTFIYIFGALFVLNLILAFIAVRADADACGAFGAFSFLSGIVFAVLLITALTKDIRAERIVNEYEYTKSVIETYYPYDYGNTELVTARIFNINSRIAEHKAKYQNPWFSAWYSEKVANLKPLTFKPKAPVNGNAEQRDTVYVHINN